MKDNWDLFDNGYLSRNLPGIRQGLENKLEGEDPEYILNVNKDEYLSHVVDEYTVDPVSIDFSALHAETETVRGETKYILYFPVSGNLDLLKLQPSEFNGWSEEASLTEDKSEFYVQLNLDDNEPDSEIINSTIDFYEEQIKENLESLLSEIEEFNDELEEHAERVFDELKRNYLKDRKIEEEIDIPVNIRADRPNTFAIESPEEQEEIKVEKPDVSETSPLEAVPTLDESTYMNLLRAIYDVGKGFERSPRLFLDREEEDLRDYMMFFLEANFEGAATGETFNNQGKTDILLRHEGDNVFIAECAWWNGKQRFLDKISQLSRYLTWRDTKTAVILFSNNQSRSAVHEQIVEGAKEHPQFKEFVERKEKSWFQYKFNFPEDVDRTIDLAVLVFHLRRSS